MDAFVSFFRRASPYINAHRGKTFVIGFGGEAVLADDFVEFIHDVALLNSLGIRLVLVHGARPQIDARLAVANINSSPLPEQRRITDAAMLPFVKEAIGGVRIRIEALLSMGLANSPMHNARLQVSSGNVVTARPIGVKDGIDFGFSGMVRRIDHGAISRWLDDGAVVLLSPLGYSPTGQAFSLRAVEVATAAAIALRADKMMLFYEGNDLLDGGNTGELVRQLDFASARRLHSRTDLPDDASERLENALEACSSGVRRSHLLRRDLPGGLLLELFTRDGIGTLIAADGYEDLRGASIDDVAGVLELIRPLEVAGVLARRSRELLEVEIDRFNVVERDGAIIGCAALYPFADEHIGELACLAIAHEYRNHGRAELLLAYIEGLARNQGLTRLFVLTTQTAHWFIEHGFEEGQLNDLPLSRQQFYNMQRKSKVFIKSLTV